MTKRIWLFNHYARSPQMSGGTRHFDIAKELVNKGYSVTIFASSFLHEKKKDILPWNKFVKIEELSGVRFVWIKTIPYKGNGVGRLLNMISYAFGTYIVAAFCGKADLIVGSSVHLFACVSAHWISLYKNCTYVSEIRDLWPQTLIDMGILSPSSLTARFFSSLERYVYRISDKIIVLLPDAGRYIEEKGVPSRKIVYLPNGVAVDRFNRLRPVAIESEELIKIVESREFFICIYAGAHGPANALNNIVEAARILGSKGYEQIRFIFVGDGPEKSYLMKSAEDINTVDFFDPVPKDVVQWLMTAAGACIFNLKDIDTFKYGISPNKLFDYMLSGTPVIFACNASNDLIHISGGGLSISPERPEELAEAITKLYKMSIEERQIMGNSAMAYVIANHDVKIIAERFINEVLEG